MKSALILFPDEWLRFSPSMLNLYHCLKEDGYHVEVIAGNNTHFDNAGILPDLRLVDYSGLKMKLNRKLGKYQQAKIKVFKDAVERHVSADRVFDIVFGADSAAFLIAKNLNPKAVFFSLEIKRDDMFNRCVELGIDHMIIQSEERYAYLLPEGGVNYSLVQNAPILPKKFPIKTAGKKVLYMGNVDYNYGIESLLEAVVPLEDYQLTLKGFCSPKFMLWLKDEYNEAIENGTIQLDFEYTDQSQMIDYIRNYSIGVTGYDLEQAKLDYNYYSSPAGKLFNYYAAGLPVLGVAIDGLSSVRSFNAGVLLDSLSAESIYNALTNIESNYQSYSAGSLEAAVHFDFKVGYRNFMNQFDPIHA